MKFVISLKHITFFQMNLIQELFTDKKDYIFQKFRNFLPDLVFNIVFSRTFGMYTRFYAFTCVFLHEIFC